MRGVGIEGERRSRRYDSDESMVEGNETQAGRSLLRIENSASSTTNQPELKPVSVVLTSRNYSRVLSNICGFTVEPPWGSILL